MPTWPGLSLGSKIESRVAVTPIVMVFPCSGRRRFSVPVANRAGVAHSLGHRGCRPLAQPPHAGRDAGERDCGLIEAGV